MPPKLSSSGSDMLDSAKRLLGVDANRPKSACEKMEDAVCGALPSLTWEQRLLGCGFCFLLGLLLELGSFVRFMQLLKGDPAPFAIIYTIGNVLSLCSSCFLCGPWSQVKGMFASKRAAATTAYLLALVFTFVIAFTPHVAGRGPLLIICIVVQFVAMVWYLLSYVPYGQTIVLNACYGCCGCREMM